MKESFVIKKFFEKLKSAGLIKNFLERVEGCENKSTTFIFFFFLITGR